MTNFDDFLKNLRIFNNFPKDFGGVFFTSQFHHFIAFLLLNISGQIVENFHNCGKFGHPKCCVCPLRCLKSAACGSAEVLGIPRLGWGALTFQFVQGESLA